jgi:hypothetical protein
MRYMRNLINYRHWYVPDTCPCSSIYDTNLRVKFVTLCENQSKKRQSAGKIQGVMRNSFGFFAVVARPPIPSARALPTSGELNLKQDFLDRHLAKLSVRFLKKYPICFAPERLLCLP